MPVESAADLAGMFDTADHAVSALWKIGGAGAGVTVAAIVDSPDGDAFGGGLGAVARRSLATLPMAAAPSLARGDTLTIAGIVWRVEKAEADIERAVLTVTLGVG